MQRRPQEAEHAGNVHHLPRRPTGSKWGQPELPCGLQLAGLQRWGLSKPVGLTPHCHRPQRLGTGFNVFSPGPRFGPFPPFFLEGRNLLCKAACQSARKMLLGLQGSRLRVV